MTNLQEKAQITIQAVEDLVKLLDRCQARHWSAKFQSILAALLESNHQLAINKFKEIPMVNMGGFLDLILCEENGHIIRNLQEDNDLLQSFSGEVLTSFDDLESFLSTEQ